MIYFCCNDRRRSLVKLHPTLNGIDFLEVVDNKNDPPTKRQRVLLVHMIKNIAPGQLTVTNVTITGGERIRNIKIVSVFVEPVTSPPLSPPALESNVLVVQVAAPGDFSTYTLSLILGPDNPNLPPPNFDPILSSVDFSFKVGCQSNFDCRPTRVCPPEPLPQPEIDYLAKDYASFRQLMLDRMALLTPQWTERNAADLGIVIVELLAYVGDYLSYQQDAVATEAYLGTARRRVSVRRHARLVDYFMHDGSNARTWVRFELRSDVTSLPLKRQPGKTTTQLLTQVDGLARIIPRDSADFVKAQNAAPVVFELIEDTTLFAAHNRISFHTWGSLECCLSRGATTATLRGSFPNLHAGDVLVFAEVLGPGTGVPEDADPTRRCAVRLTNVTPNIDPLGDTGSGSPAFVPVDVTDISWDEGDALPFPICVSSQQGQNAFSDVSIVFGNVALADHGATVSGELLSIVPPPNPLLTAVAEADGSRCSPQTPVSAPARYRPALQNAPLTMAVPLDTSNLPDASATIGTSAADGLPSISLTVPPDDTDNWSPQRDLIESGPEDKQFVAEVEEDGTAYLRFGDGQFGLRPAPGTQFVANYRVGNGEQGNIGADSLYHIVSDDPGIVSDLLSPVITKLTNPLPAEGGVDPESIDQVRRYAPAAFRSQERAVTADDYAQMALRPDNTLQDAAATFRWTGSWHTVFLTADRKGDLDVTPEYAAQLRSSLEQFRMAGYDLEVDGPIFVPLDVEMTVCILPNYFQSDVLSALDGVLGNGVLPNGQRGVFHPSNFKFGQTVYLSPIYAAAQSVAGVSSVLITKFDRQGGSSSAALTSGELLLDRLEIARLDNDPNFPDRGVLTIVPQGGR